MDYRNKNFDDYENFYELDIDNFEELREELEKTIFENIHTYENNVYFFGNSDNTNPFNNLTGINAFRKKTKITQRHKIHGQLCYST